MVRRSTILILVCLLISSSQISVSGVAEESQDVLVWVDEIQYSGTGDEVILRGEWNWSQNLSMQKVDGVWTSGPLDLEPGLYCYKLVIDGEWSLNPDEPQTTWCDGVENSLHIQRNKSVPILVIDGFSVEGSKVVGSIIVYSNGESLTDVEVQFESGEDVLVQHEGNLIEFTASNLSEGKYRISITASSPAGEVEDLLIPFWVEDQTFLWQDSLMYMVMTDRYIDGNSSNNPLPLDGAAHGGDWLGGDFAGLHSNLDNISALGINTLWMSPFNQGPEGLETAADGTHRVAGYHGYWPVEPREVDSRFGTAEELKALITAAHSRGIRVMADIVINHVHEDHPYFTENPDWFSDGCTCGSGGCDWTDRRLDCLFMPYMPDVDWTNRDASEQMISDIIWWVEEFNLDALRLDAVKHVHDSAINNIAARISERFEQGGVELYLKGETAMGWVDASIEANAEEYGTINRYMGDGGLDGQADFVLYHAVVDNVLTSGNKGLIHLDYWTWASQQQFVEDSVMVPYIGSHDVPRFISRADPDAIGVWNQWSDLPGETSNPLAMKRWELAMAWLLTIPGAPMIYAGDEHAMEGGADPDNRRMFDMSGGNDTWVSQLGRLRGELESLRRGEYVQLEAEEEIMAFARQTADEHVVVVLNRGGEGLDLSGHEWLGEMKPAFGDVPWNGGVIEMAGSSAAIFSQIVVDVEDNQTNTQDDQTNTQDNQTNSEENQSSAQGNQSTVDSNVSSPDDDTAEPSADDDKVAASSGNVIEEVRWVLIALVIVTILFLFRDSRRGGGEGVVESDVLVEHSGSGESGTGDD